MQIKTGRTNGPCTDMDVDMAVTVEELEVVKDTLVAVKLAAGNKEGWYVEYPNEDQVIPNCNKKPK
jgi:hypothetical protein